MHNFAITHNFAYERLVFNDCRVDNGRINYNGLRPPRKDCVICFYGLSEFNLCHIYVGPVLVKIIPILDCHYRIPCRSHHIVTEGASVGEIPLVGRRRNNIKRIYEMHPQNDNIFPGGKASVANLVFAIVVQLSSLEILFHLLFLRDEY